MSAGDFRTVQISSGSEARGRNGWFNVDHIHVFETGGNVRMEVESKKSWGTSPIIVNMPLSEWRKVLRAFLEFEDPLVKAVGEEVLKEANCG